MTIFWDWIIIGFASCCKGIKSNTLWKKRQLNLIFGKDPESFVSIEINITTMDPKMATDLFVVCIFVTELQGMMQSPDYMVNHIVIEVCNE